MTRNPKMSPARRQLVLGALAVSAGVTALPAMAQELQQGRDFNLLNPPQPVDAGGKIEVIEFFWYGCNHCHALEVPLEGWLKKLPGDVAFRRVPAIFNEGWAVAGRVYYALEAMGKLNDLHKPLFDAIHKDGLRIQSESALTDWLKGKGVDPAEYRKQSRSFAVEGRLRRAAQMTETYKFESVPTLVVNGRYVTVSTGPDALLRRVDGLIERARRDPK